TFIEFGLNLTAFGFDTVSISGGGSGSNVCDSLFGGIIVKTRTSASFTSQLKDFAGPFPFGDVQVSTVTIDGDNLDCNATSVTLTAVTSIQSGLQYQWYKDGVLIAGQVSSQLIVTAPGIYKVVVTPPGFGGPGTGCSSEAEFEV